MREMRRVWVPGGRRALNVARSLPYNPYLCALADALERYIARSKNRDAGPVQPGEAETRRTLLTRAGFCDIRLHTMILTIRPP